MAEINKKASIAKNTVFLYFRMMFTMIVTLFTSRVILQALGIDDYGIYETVGGVVGMIAFVNKSLASGTSRFLTFELGSNNKEKLKRTFSTVLAAHILLSILIVVVAETVGLWFVHNKLTIAPDRMDAAVFTYHLSIIAVVFTITQVPYNASIISHEKMSIYAYTTIIEVVLKLGIVYLLYISPFDKLKTYSLLYCSVSILMALYYRYYCIRHFNETRFRIIFDKEIFKNVLSYSGWNLFANTSIALNNQGATILINMFFNSAVVTARSIASQVNMAAYHFVSNFRTAVNPQIVKRYAKGDYYGSKHLLLESTKYSYFLMFLLALPMCFEAETILKLWLGVLPEYSVIFLQLTLITSLFQVFDTSFYTALYAKGRIKENAMISPTLGFCIFPIVYILFKLGCSPIALAIALLVLYMILGLFVKPCLMVKIVGYKWSEIFPIYITCLKVTLASLFFLIVFVVLSNGLFSNDIIKALFTIIIAVISVLVSVWIFGISDNIKSKLLEKIQLKIK